VIDFCQELIRSDLRIRWGSNSRVDTLNEEMALWMKRAGCYVIAFGAESANQLILDKMNKGSHVAQIESCVDLCAKQGVESFLMFVIGLPWDTNETLADTIDFVKRTKASFIEVNVAYPLPGTDLFSFAQANGLFDEKDLCGHDHSAPLIRSFTLSTEELSRKRKEILRAFYLRPSYIMRRVRRINSPKLALNHLRYGARLISNLFA
jgi:radical SAM superfamily enzyme YgiQ (UPF0313 family)